MNDHDLKLERLESAKEYCQGKGITQLERIVQLEDELIKTLVAVEKKDIDHQGVLVEIRAATRPILQNAPMILALATPEE